MTSPPEGQVSVLRAEAVGFSVEGRTLLDGVTLACGPAQCIGVIGPNGAGKSTLLRLLAGVLPPSRGRVLLGGTPLARMDRRSRARRIAYVPQTQAAGISMSVLEMVLLGRHPYGSPFSPESPEDLAAVERAIRYTRIEGLVARDVRTLSGGERQRVYLARALAQTPRVLVLDEPTASLDLHHAFHSLGMVRRLADDGLAVIMAIHDLELAAAFCDRLLLLKDGRPVALGTPREVLTPRALEQVYGLRTRVSESPWTGRLRVEVSASHAPG